jgi:cytochrome c oxidase cbb3-type subunit 3
MSTRKKDDVTGVETTGHSWDGIEELNSPLPRWWLWTFYGTTVWAIVYTVLFPAWPLISSATAGVLGWSTRAEVAEAIAAVEAQNAPVEARLAAVDMTVLAGDADLHGYAVNAGAAVFRAHCSQCHGSGAAGAVGYPNLLDDDWLWGGTIEDIVLTIRHGIRNTDDADARYSEMPAFGEILSAEEIGTLVAHVQGLSQGADPAAGEGAQLFADNCASCHGEDGRGLREVGAPNLADAIWLYGGDDKTLTQTITYARYGVMPAWGLRLSEAEVRAAAAYVHQLGGGEPAP